MAKLLKKITLWIAAIAILFIVIFIAASLVFQERISTYALLELDKLTNNQLNYEAAQLDYIKSFPNLSLDLREPKFIDKDYNQALHLEELQLQLNIFSTIFSNPTIDKLFIKNGSVKLIERNGKWNVEDLMTSSKSNDRTSFFNIHQLIVEDFDITIDKTSTNQMLEFVIDQAEINLNSDDNDKVQLSSKGTVELKSIRSNNKQQSVNYRDRYSLELDYDKTDRDLNIFSCKFSNGISISGDYNTESSIRDITVKANNLNLKELNPIMEKLDVNKHGLFKFMGTTTGDLHLIGKDEYDYNFSLDHIGILLNKGIRESDITDFNGIIVGTKDELYVKDFKGRIERKEIVVDGHIDLVNNKINTLQVNGDIPIMTLMTLSNDTTLRDLRGSINFEEIKIVDCPLKDIGSHIIESSEINAKPEDVKWRYLNRPWMQLNSGDVEIRNGYLQIANMNLTYQNTDLQLNGDYHKALDKHNWKLNIESDDFELDKMLAYFQESDDEVSFNFDDYELDIRINAKSVTHKGVLVDDMTISLLTDINGHKLNTKGKAFGGEFFSDGVIENYNAINHFATKVELKSFDITECLKQNNNFNQDFISHKNLEGELTSYGTYDFYWDKQWNYQPDKTKAAIYSKLKNGELIDLEMLNNFSKYVNIKDLQKVKFTELNNFFEINGESIFIPTMFIQSNAANFTMSGLHDVNNKQQYYMQVNAGQILANKFRKHDSSLRPKPAKRNGWFNMYYVITSDDGINYSYKKDRSKVKASFKNGESRKRFIYQRLISSFGNIEDLSIPDEWRDK